MNKYCRTSLSYTHAVYRLRYAADHSRGELIDAARVVLNTRDADPDDCVLAHVYRDNYEPPAPSGWEGGFAENH